MISQGTSEKPRDEIQPILKKRRRSIPEEISDDPEPEQVSAAKYASNGTQKYKIHHMGEGLLSQGAYAATVT